MDMNTVIHETRAPGNYKEDLQTGRSQVQILNEKYKIDGAKWTDYGEFAEFLSGLHEYGA
jgi:hypothetical protein